MLVGSSKSLIVKTHTTTMIITQQQANIKSNGVQGAVSFGIKQEGLAHIFNVLRNQLYTNKILAVLREYSCNAVDAHTEAGIPDRQIKVTLPNRIAPELKIRDYGQGLSEQDIQNIYAFYGESTKRQSNALIGQLGLGSKSAFAYGDNFVINTFNNGMKTSYNAFIDASQIGQIAKLFSQPTDEETGIEIVVPVRMEDIADFEVQAKRVFQYFKVRPEITGVQIDFEKEEYAFVGEAWKVLAANKKTGYYYEGQKRNTIAVMGNIGYTIDTYALKLSSENSNDQVIDSFLRTLSPIIDFQIGDLEISASREGLQYTERTIKNIKSKLLDIIAELKTRFETELEKADSIWKARQLIGDTMDMYHPYNYITKASKSFKWKGVTLKSSAIDFKSMPKSVTDAIKIYRPRRGYVGSNSMIKGAEVTECGQIINYNIDSNVVLLENKRGLKGGIVNYAFNFLKDEKKVIVVDTSAGNRDSILSNLGAVETDMVDMGTLQKLNLPRANSSRTSTGGSTSVKAKQGESVFILDTTQHKTYSNTRSDFWTQEVIDTTRPQDYVWIGIDRFEGVVKNNGVNLCPKKIMRHLSDLENLHKKLGVSYTAPKVIGIKISSKNTAPKGVKHIKDYLEETMRSLDAQHNIREFFEEVEFQENFQNENVVLARFFESGYNGTQKYANTKQLMKLVKALKDRAYDSHIKDSVLRCLADHNVKRSEVLTHELTQEFQTTKAKLSMLETTMRILKYVDPYELASYKDNRNKALEAIADLLESRDANLQGAVAM